MLQIPLCVSLGSMMLCAALNWAIQRFGKQPAVLGFTAPATHPAMYPAAEPSGTPPPSTRQADFQLCCALAGSLQQPCQPYHGMQPQITRLLLSQSLPRSPVPACRAPSPRPLAPLLPLVLQRALRRASQQGRSSSWQRTTQRTACSSRSRRSRLSRKRGGSQPPPRG